MRKFLLASFAILGATSATASAAAETNPTNIPETVVVTATGTEQPRELTGTSISVITAADLATEQTLVVTDALKETPGLNVVRNGGVGQTTTIGIRGAQAGQTLVLIDGVRLNDPSAPDDSAILSDLLANNVDHIEVLRGPQSTLYGSDAIGGVVNILSKRGGGMPFAFVGSAEGGSLGTYRLNAATNGTVHAVDYGAAANYYNTRGISAADSHNGNTEPDAYRNFGATGNARLHLTDTVSFDLRGYYTNARTDFDGFPPPTFTLRDTSEYGTDKFLAGYTGVNFDLFSGRFRSRVAFTASDSDRKNFDPTLPIREDFFARGDAQRFEYQGIVDVTSMDQITFGAETQRTTLNTGSPSVFDPHPTPIKGRARIDGYYAQYQTTLLDQLTLTGGVRYDDDQKFGGHTSIKLASAWSLFEGTTVLRANYGDGFKAPSLYELFSPYSNPVKTLAPESASGWETGIDQKFFGGRAQASVTYFERRTKDQIDFFSCFGVVSPACALRPFGYYDNIDRSRARGIEIELAAHLLDTVTLSGGLTDLAAIDLSTHNDLARRPDIMANARVVWTPTPTWSFGASVSHTGRSFDDRFESVPLSSYTLANLFGSYALTDQVQVFLRVENLFDQHYEQAAGYGSLGRTVSAGLRVTM